MRRATPSPGSSPCPSRRPSTAPSITGSGGGSRPCSATSRRAASAWRTATSAAPSAWTASSSSWRWPCSGRSRPGCGTRSTAPRRTKKSPGPTTPQPPPRPDLPLQARHPPPPGVPATARRPTAVVGRVAELMGGKVCVVDATGRIVREAKVASEPEALVDFFRRLGLPLARVGLEAGPLSQWLHAGLAGAGFEAVLLETRQVKAALSAMIVKTDRKDARGIAQLLRMGWYRPPFPELDA